MSACQICNTPTDTDLFAAVTNEGVCSVCKVRHIGGLPTTPARIAEARTRLGLEEGQFLTQDAAQEATRILGRTRR